MTLIEDETRELVVLRFLTGVTSSFGDRASRRFDKLKFSLGARLKSDPKKTVPEDSGLVLKLGFSDEAINWARKINLGIHEFKEAHPKYGEILQEMINKHRSSRRGYLEFGGEVSDEIYIGLVQTLAEGISYREAETLYRSIVDLGNALGKQRGEISKSLLQE